MFQATFPEMTASSFRRCLETVRSLFGILFAHFQHEIPALEIALIHSDVSRNAGKKRKKERRMLNIVLPFLNVSLQAILNVPSFFMANV